MFHQKILMLMNYNLKKIAESEYQSYTDLLNRRDTIKRSIVISNATTHVVTSLHDGRMV